MKQIQVEEEINQIHFLEEIHQNLNVMNNTNIPKLSYQVGSAKKQTDINHMIRQNITYNNYNK